MQITPNIIGEIKKLLEQGYNRNQIEEFLIQQGFNIQEINYIFSNLEPINSVAISPKNINIKDYIIFSILFLLCTFTFQKTVLTFIFLPVFFMILPIENFLKRTNIKFKKVILFFVYLFSLFLLLYFIEFFLAIFVIFLMSIKYYFGTYKKHSLFKIYFIFFYSFLLTFLFWLFKNLLLIEFVKILNFFSISYFIYIYILNIIVNVLIFPVFLVIVIKLLKNKLGEFDFEGFFKFKFILFRIFNFFSTPQNNIKGSIKMLSIFIFVIYLIFYIPFGLILMFENYDDSFYRISEYIPRDKSNIDYNFLLNKYDNFKTQNDYSNINFKNLNKFDNLNTIKEYIQNIYRIDKIQFINAFYDCDLNLNCNKKTTIDENKFSFESFEKHNIFGIAQKNNSFDLYFFKNYDNKVLVNQHLIYEEELSDIEMFEREYSSFYEENITINYTDYSDLKKTQIYKDIEKQNNDFLTYLYELNINKSNSFWDFSIKSFTGEIDKDLINILFLYTKTVLLSQSNIMSKKHLIEAYFYIKNTNKSLKDEIKFLENKLSNHQISTKEELSFKLKKGFSEIKFKDIFFEEKLSNYLDEKLSSNFYMNDLNRYVPIFVDLQYDMFSDFKNMDFPQESDLSRYLRLRVKLKLLDVH